MVNIVYYHNKKSGMTYAYESMSYWDEKSLRGSISGMLILRPGNEVPKRFIYGFD